MQPFDSSDWTWYTDEAERLNEAYPTTSSQIKNADFDAWAQEGYDMAKNNVYPGKF